MPNQRVPADSAISLSSIKLILSFFALLKIPFESSFATLSFSTITSISSLLASFFGDVGPFPSSPPSPSSSSPFAAGIGSSGAICLGVVLGDPILSPASPASPAFSSSFAASSLVSATTPSPSVTAMVPPGSATTPSPSVTAMVPPGSATTPSPSMTATLSSSGGSASEFSLCIRGRRAARCIILAALTLVAAAMASNSACSATCSAVFATCSAVSATCSAVSAAAAARARASSFTCFLIAAKEERSYSNNSL